MPDHPPDQHPGQTDGPSLGPLVRRRRLERRLSLQKLADRVGCAKSYLSQIETGRARAPAEQLVAALERELDLPGGTLAGAARWERTPEPVRGAFAELERTNRFGKRLAEIIAARGVDGAFQSGELRRLVDALTGQAHDGGGAQPIELPMEVPLINRVQAGYPREFTDLGYPARVADEYVRCPDLHDPDAFAARVVGDSMAPEYKEGDIVVFSPARPVASGMDCFARLEPDHDSTFKRVYFETGAAGEQLIRLQPINSAYPPRVCPREEVAGLYAAVTVMRSLV